MSLARLKATTRALFAFAGIYRQWNDPIKKDGDNVDLSFLS